MKERIAFLSVIANLILAIGKILIGFISNSVSVLAEGIHSSMDVLSSIVGLVGIKISNKPVDEKHPYGHYKYEVLSGIIITFILFITGIWILYESYQGFINHKNINFGYLTLIVMGLSALINEVMARIKIYYGKKENSVSLLSDGVHSRVDVFASLAVFIGLIINPYWRYADSLLAFLIGLYIIKESFELGKEATDSLLDVSAGEEIENKIKSIAESEDIELEEIKTQKKGSAITANLILKLPNNLSVEEATKLSENFRNSLLKKIENLKYVAIQIKSHDVKENYYRPREIISRMGFLRGLGWGGRIGKVKTDYCVCINCGYKTKHKPGIPCSTIKCPKCGERLRRE